MTPERWKQIEDVYHVVATRPECERAGVLAELCVGDQELRQEVESFLAHAGPASAFLETPPLTSELLVSARSIVGRQFGVYSVLAPIGSGGMGEVYRAHDTQLGRDVAIK